MKWIDLMLVFKDLSSIDFLEGCSQSEFQTILAIDECINQTENEKIHVNKIADVLKVSVPAVSKSLKNLESKKMIKRNVDVFCRRNTFVELTKKGKEILNKNLKVINDLLVKAFGNEIDEKISTIINVAKEIKEALVKGGDFDVSTQ